MKDYFRPVVMHDASRPAGVPPLAGGALWFEYAERLGRDRGPERLHWRDLPGPVLEALSRPRADLMGLSMDRPRLMGILNVTPDSFSDGGRFFEPGLARARAAEMAAEGAEILDIGGESTRPGSDPVPEAEEIRRTVPLIAALSGRNLPPVSIDTRKAAVADAALSAGAAMVNDVAALGFDPALATLVAERNVPLCLMHARGDPKTMQVAPHYDDVLLDVWDYLSGRIAAATAAGIARDRLVVDPGIGFGKTLDHNLRLLRNLSLFHGFGLPVLLGASRKRFIGTLGGAEDAARRMPGSLAIALEGAAQGVQILRIHDIWQTRQALTLWQAVR
jgi:dihydropteroate synthase